MRDKSNYKHYENISIMPQMETLTFEAESVAYTVCDYLGIDTGDYSFGYIAGWSRGRELKELKESMETIRKTASKIISGIEDRCFDKNAELENVKSEDLEPAIKRKKVNLHKRPEQIALA